MPHEFGQFQAAFTGDAAKAQIIPQERQALQRFCKQ
jgi:hypothetical protein